MSQEINLLNPTLRRRRDWLSSDYVAKGALAALLLVALLFSVAHFQMSAAQRRSSEVADQLRNAQQELQAAQGALAARKADPALEQEVLRLTTSVRQGRALYRLAEMTTQQGSAGVAEVMRGFSRQIAEGVWLTGFTVGPDNFEIRGRLLDSSQLPAYIRRLNAESAFRGRRFAALDMHAAAEDNVAATPTAPVAPAASVALPAAAPRYTEFALRASSEAPGPAAGARP